MKRSTKSIKFRRQRSKGRTHDKLGPELKTLRTALPAFYPLLRALKITLQVYEIIFYFL